MWELQGRQKLGRLGNGVTTLVHLPYQSSPLALLGPPGSQGRVPEVEWHLSLPSLGVDREGALLVACKDQAFLRSQFTVPFLCLALGLTLVKATKGRKDLPMGEESFWLERVSFSSSASVVWGPCWWKQERKATVRGKGARGGFLDR